MKRISPFFLAAALLAAPVVLRGQDAALEERLNKLSALIQDATDAREVQNKKIEALAKQLEAIQQQQNKPNVTYASAEDVKQLAAKLQEIDRKRQDDNERILKELDRLAKSLRAAPPGRSTASGAGGSAADAGATSRSDNPAGGNAPKREESFPYVVKEKDTIWAIVKAYNEQGVKVTEKQILNANPGLKPETLKPGTTIFIPAPPRQ